MGQGSCELGGWPEVRPEWASRGGQATLDAGVGIFDPANAHMRAEWRTRSRSGQVRAQKSEVADLQVHLAANPVVGGRVRKARRVLDP
jgi:hypothetical protein